MKRFALLSMAILAVTFLSCNKNPDPQPEPEPEENYFFKGADCSWITEMETKGYKFYNADGDEMECTALLKEAGFDAVRYRIWVNPTDKYNSKEDVLEKAKRAQDLGMKIMLDFHLSDTWADPGKQTVPAAWADYSVPQLASAVAEHIVEVLTYFSDNKIDVTWVQVGNEVTNGFLWEGCRVRDGDAQDFVYCFNCGAAAVRKIYPYAKVVLHVDNAWDMTTLTWFFDLIKKNGAIYDIIGLSLYPSYWDSSKKAYPDWKTKAQQAVDNFYQLHNRYNMPIMLVEFGMPASEPEKAKECLQYLIDGTSYAEWFHGIFYWEPESEHSRNGYDYGAFANGKPTAALDPFKE